MSLLVLTGRMLYQYRFQKMKKFYLNIFLISFFCFYLRSPKIYLKLES